MKRQSMWQVLRHAMHVHEEFGHFMLTVTWGQCHEPQASQSVAAVLVLYFHLPHSLAAQLWHQSLHLLVGNCPIVSPVH
jgi:hypothetical protein